MISIHKKINYFCLFLKEKKGNMTIKSITHTHCVHVQHVHVNLFDIKQKCKLNTHDPSWQKIDDGPCVSAIHSALASQRALSAHPR